MAAASISVPRGSPSCLLPLLEAIQYQQVCLIQVPFKLLPLCWDLERVYFCMHPYEQSLGFLQLSGTPEHKPHWLLSQTFWRLVFLIQDPGLGSSMLVLDSMLLRDDCHSCDIPPACASLHQGCGP